MRYILFAILLPGMARPAVAQCDRELKIDTQVVAKPEPGDGFHPAQFDDRIEVVLDHDAAQRAVDPPDESRRLAQACGRDV
jgi:hypothetical protein